MSGGGEGEGPEAKKKVITIACWHVNEHPTTNLEFKMLFAVFADVKLVYVMT